MYVLYIKKLLKVKMSKCLGSHSGNKPNVREEKIFSGDWRPPTYGICDLNDSNIKNHNCSSGVV